MKFIIFVLCFASAAEAAELIYQNDFESGDLATLKCSGNCPGISKQIAFGSYAGDFVLTRDMKTNYRTEVVLGKTGQFHFKQEYWLGLNYWYEDWQIDSDREIAPLQLHVQASSWDKRCNKFKGGASHHAPFVISSKFDTVYFTTFGNNDAWEWPLQRKQWHSIVVHFKISPDPDGYIEAWNNGKYLGKIDGPNSYKSDKCDNPMREPYFKMGVYKWNWKKMTYLSDKRQLIIDNLKIARGDNGYNLVKPASK